MFVTFNVVVALIFMQLEAFTRTLPFINPAGALTTIAVEPWPETIFIPPVVDQI